MSKPEFHKGEAVSVKGQRGYVLRVFEPHNGVWRYLVQWLESKPRTDRYEGFVTAFNEKEIGHVAVPQP